MAGVVVTVDLGPILAYIASAAQSVPAVYAATRDVVEEVTGEIEDRARELAPEGPTGDLKGSIQSNVSGLYGRVYTDLRYAPYVEFGTWKDPVQPFMIPAQEQFEQEYPARLERQVLPVVQRYLG